MRINYLSKSLNDEIESNVDLMSKFFTLQKITACEKINEDVLAAPNGDSTFLLTNFEGGIALFDVLDVKDNLQIEMLKHDSIRKLIEIKKGKVVHLKNSLVGSVLPTRP
ncbi:MAG: hypothetical protein GOU98_01185 [Candidatus Altiarchaeota archaeon]|nr:hypothetical protein [Candidatus Altiarchaeota archaeon]